MATTLKVFLNITDETQNYQDEPKYYAEMDLAKDGLIWTAGSTGTEVGAIKDKMQTIPNETKLNEAAPVIDENAPYVVPLCLFYDYSGDDGYYTHEVKGMGEDARWVFAFSFDGETATEPQLEAWDDSGRDSCLKYVLGGSDESPLEHPEDSMVLAVATNAEAPGDDWEGTPIAGADNVLLLNNGYGPLNELDSGVTSQELYANIKIVIPANFGYPAVESFLLTVRYTYA